MITRKPAWTPRKLRIIESTKYQVPQRASKWSVSVLFAAVRMLQVRGHRTPTRATNRYLIGLSNESALLSYCAYESIPSSIHAGLAVPRFYYRPDQSLHRRRRKYRVSGHWTYFLFHRRQSERRLTHRVSRLAAAFSRFQSTPRRVVFSLFIHL